MEYIKSKDGTQIAYEKIGIGKSLIIIGGSLADHQMYVPLASALSKKLTVFNYDRRNRGKSGTSANHTIETELDDLKVIISLCNESPILYGHSAGSALAIRAATNGLSISTLVLSDIPYSLSTDDNEVEAKRFEEERKTIKEFLTIGDKTGAVKFFLNDFGMNEQELNAFVASENGGQAVVNSVTLPVDYDLLGNGLTPIELLRKVQVPTLILTSDYGLAVAEDAAKYLLNCKIAVLESPTYNLAADEIAMPIFKFLERT
jgi:pimeloyl-ACP methyl ester carboxylesterase